MDIDQEKHARALKKAQQIIQRAQKNKGVQTVEGLDQFKAGDFNFFRDEQSIKDLSQYILHLINMQNELELQELFAVLKKGVEQDHQVIRESSILVVTYVAREVSENTEPSILQLIVDVQISWLIHETENFKAIGAVCKQIQEIGLIFLKVGFWQDSKELFITIFKIQIQIYDKPDFFKDLIIKVQDNLATKDNLELLVGVYLSENNPYKADAENILIYLGRRSVIFCLNLLMRSERKEERIALIKLLPHAGSVGVPILIDCLEKNPPWFVIRNIIFIISEIGDSSLYSIIRPYAANKDIRVQQQVISCIAKFGGTRMKSRLIEALPLVDDDLKVQLVMQLGQMEGEDVELALLDLLEKRHRFSSRFNSHLLLTLCISMKKYPSERVVEGITELIEEQKSFSGDGSEEIVNVAMDTLSVIKPKLRHILKTVNTDLDFVSFDDDPVDEHAKKNNVRQVEERAFELAANDDLDEVTSFLVNQVRILARDKDFGSAEYLRDKLLELNPMALNEVIAVGEFIEEEKNSSIASSHIEVWDGLYDTMTTEQFNALYYAMTLENYDKGEEIVSAGDTDPSLYFINSGVVNLSCRVNGEEMFLKRMQPGDIVGVSPFFSVSVWTYSLKAEAESQISVLHRDAFNELRDDFPGLEEKLEKYCNQFDVGPQLVRMSGSDRREFPRYQVSIIVSSMLLDPYGNPGKRSFKGELLDISRGGLCFTISISSKGNARMLLGRKIVCQIKLANKDLLETAGVIVGVKYLEQMASDFAIHVKFHTLIPESSVMQVVNLKI